MANSILVPTDFSDQSLEAVKLARSLALENNASITLLYVVDNFPVIGYPMPMEYNNEKLYADALETARMDLSLLVSNKFPGSSELHCAVAIGTPDEEIIRYAGNHHCDTIVIATHGRTGLRHLLLGSVAERVLRKSPIQVLCVKTALNEEVSSEGALSHAENA